jgi:hypothetical protein
MMSNVHLTQRSVFGLVVGIGLWRYLHVDLVPVVGGWLPLC